MTVARELEARMWLIADPKTKWVQRWPEPGECCLVYDGGANSFALSLQGLVVLGCLVEAEGCALAGDFNDYVARNRDDVIQFLDEAAALAKWLGI